MQSDENPDQLNEEQPKEEVPHPDGLKAHDIGTSTHDPTKKASKTSPASAGQ